MLFCENWAKINGRVAEFGNCIFYKFQFLFIIIDCDVYNSTQVQSYTQFPVACSVYNVTPVQLYKLIPIAYAV